MIRETQSSLLRHGQLKIKIFKAHHFRFKKRLREVPAGDDVIAKTVPGDGNRAAKFVSRVLDFFFTAVFQLHLQRGA